MARKLSAKKLAEQLDKQLDKQIEAYYYEYSAEVQRAVGEGIVLNVLDISKVFRAGRIASDAGADIRKAVRAAADAVRLDAGPRIAVA